MKRVVQYLAIDPYYSDITQEYIGTSEEEIDNIQYETEEFMKGENLSLSSIYDVNIIENEKDEQYINFLLV